MALQRITAKKLPTDSLHPNYRLGAGKSTMVSSKVHEAIAKNETIVVGSMHTYTDGIGYGMWRTGPASPRFKTPREKREQRWDKTWTATDRENNMLHRGTDEPPPFGGAQGWKHRGPRGHRARCMEARTHLTSGEVGSWNEHEHPSLDLVASEVKHCTPRKRYAAPGISAAATAAIPTLGNEALLTNMDPDPQPRHMLATLPTVTPKGVVPRDVRAHLAAKGGALVRKSASTGELDMKRGQFDPLFSRTLKQDHAFTNDRDMFKKASDTCAVFENFMPSGG